MSARPIGTYYVNLFGDINLETADGARLIAYADEVNANYREPAQRIAERLNQWT